MVLGGGEELPVVVLAVRRILLLAVLVLVPSSQGLDHVHPSVGPSSCFLAASSLAVLVPHSAELKANPCHFRLEKVRIVDTSDNFR